ncbi:hypothetical protein ACP70R_019361 [Stipagrostis hirtigluma subsp. patula]
MKRSSSAVAAAAVLVALLAAAAAVAPPAGYTKKEDENSEFARQVSKFAVTMYGLGHMVRMYYVTTWQCWSQPAGGGANYYWSLLAATNSSGAKGNYECIVWGIPGSESKTWKLLSFNKANY